LYLSLTSCIPEISSSFLMTSLLILSSLVYPSYHLHHHHHNHHHHHHIHHHLPPCIRWFPCFGSLVLSVLSRWLIQFCFYLSLTSCIPEISSSFLVTSLLILSSLVYPVTVLRKRISAASRPVISLFVVSSYLTKYMNFLRSVCDLTVY